MTRLRKAPGLRVFDDGESDIGEISRNINLKFNLRLYYYVVLKISFLIG